MLLSPFHWERNRESLSRCLRGRIQGHRAPCCPWCGWVHTGLEVCAHACVNMHVCEELATCGRCD